MNYRVTVYGHVASRTSLVATVDVEANSPEAAEAKALMNALPWREDTESVFAEETFKSDPIDDLVATKELL